MPRSKRYQCAHCGLSFVRIGRTEGLEIPCKRCRKSAFLVRTTSASVTSDHRPEAPSPQTTGMTLVDHDPDWVIAKHATQSLHEMEVRQDYKRDLVAREKKAGRYLSRLDTGEYFFMTEEEFRASKKARIAYQDTYRQIKKKHREALRREKAKGS